MGHITYIFYLYYHCLFIEILVDLVILLEDMHLMIEDQDQETDMKDHQVNFFFLNK